MFRLLCSIVALTTFLGGQSFAQSKAASSEPRTALINLNTATIAELEVLPGIGAKTAARIVDYREKKGPFKKIEELMNVQGIGEKSFLKLKPQLTAKTASVMLAVGLDDHAERAIKRIEADLRRSEPLPDVHHAGAALGCNPAHVAETSFATGSSCYVLS